MHCTPGMWLTLKSSSGEVSMESIKWIKKISFFFFFVIWVILTPLTEMLCHTGDSLFKKNLSIFIIFKLFWNAMSASWSYWDNSNSFKFINLHCPNFWTNHAMENPFGIRMPNFFLNSLRKKNHISRIVRFQSSKWYSFTFIQFLSSTVSQWYSFTILHLYIFGVL